MPPHRAAPLLLLASALAACAGTKSAAAPRPQAEDVYKAGVAELEDKNYAEAQKLLEQVRNKYPYSKFAALADLRLADLRFKEEKFPEAAELYVQFAKLHPNHEEVDYAAFRVGLARYRDMPGDFFIFPPNYERDMSSAEAAVKGFEEFLAKYPRSKYAEEGKKKLDEVKARFAEREWYVASFYRVRQRWPGVAARLERLVKDYPGSPREPEALLGLAEAYVAMKERFRAQQALQQLLVRYPKDPRRAEAEKLLASLR